MSFRNTRRAVLLTVLVGVASGFTRSMWAQSGAISQSAVARSADPLLKTRVNGVELHYLDRGRGEPIIFVHGGLADYREWGPVAEQLMSDYRTITYSRRYNFPNDNPMLRPLTRRSWKPRTSPR